MCGDRRTISVLSPYFFTYAKVTCWFPRPVPQLLAHQLPDFYLSTSLFSKGVLGLQDVLLYEFWESQSDSLVWTAENILSPKLSHQPSMLEFQPRLLAYQIVEENYTF